MATVCFLGGTTYWLIEARSSDGLLPSLAAAGLAVSGLLALLRIELTSPAPLLPARLFRSRQFRAANATTFLVYGAIGVFFFPLVLQLQVVAGWSPRCGDVGGAGHRDHPGPVTGRWPAVPADRGRGRR